MSDSQTAALEWIGITSVAVAATAWLLLLAIDGEYHPAWLHPHANALEALFVLALAAVTLSWSLSRWRAATTRVMLAAVSIALALATSEWIARVAFRDVRSSGDERTYFARRPPIHINSLGFRDREIGAEGDYRIVVVGDSITWGQGLAEEERFTNKIQDSLDEGYEVLNFGIPGNNMPEHLEVLERALKVSPSFILLQLFINDFETPDMHRPQAYPLFPWPPLDHALLGRSALYAILAGKWTQLQEMSGIVENYPHYMKRYLGDPNSRQSSSAFGMLRQFIPRARAAGVPCGTVLFPNANLLGRRYPFGYLHARVREICIERAMTCVDLRALFTNRFPDPRVMWVSRFDPHPSAAANVVAADAILDGFRSVWQQRSGPQ